MPARTPIVTLITDFGTSDTYVGQLKGAILSRCPAARLVDLTHDIPRGDVPAAAFALLESLGAFPKGTVHLCVVDPAVGTGQARLAARAGGRCLLAPDNGLLGPALARLGRFEARRLPVRGASATFHGRDVFAPAAARLAAGESFARLGARVAPGKVNRLELPRPKKTSRGLAAEVIHVDAFGNLVTNLRPEDLPPGDLTIAVGGRTVRGLLRTYGEARPGRLLALIGSHGFLEVAAREADAARLLRARRGTRVRIGTAVKGG